MSDDDALILFGVFLGVALATCVWCMAWLVYLARKDGPR